ncbi:integrase [Enterocloster aldenensis]|uniref:tyrosine-type recombinase/integrase n=1 Tax=Enterocloster aldenensis TaxID=358742 RepID=UPI000E5187B9|nr:integrase [Enterocloster aldenensis]
MRKQTRVITPELICRYSAYLTEQEKSTATNQKYTHDLTVLCKYLAGAAVTKAALLGWKGCLTEQYAPASVNTMLAAMNGLLDFCGWQDLKVKPLKIQKSLFCDGEKELTKEEYVRLIRAAESDGNERLSLVIQAICATGIRVSELQFITAEAIQSGRAEISNKGKRRTVFLPDKLRRLLGKYLKKQKRTTGPVFITKTGKPFDRSNIWRDMKNLCKSAGVEPGKVFPHNLRHLFARTYYTLEKDLSRLADILGHSNVNTTRIYTIESGAVHARQMERMGLIIT